MYLGDITTGTGCSTELQAMIDGQMSGAGQLCQLKSSADQTAFYVANEVLLPYCSCSAELSNFADYTWSKAVGAAAAVQFAPNLSSAAYTISGQTLGLQSGDGLTARNVQGASSANAGDITSGVGLVAPLQVVIDAG